MMRFIHDNLYPLFSVLVFIIVISCWFGTSVPALPHTRTPPPEKWNLPRLVEQDGKDSVATIESHSLWGSTAASASAPKEPEWHVMGIARNGADRFILLAFEGKPVEMLKVGDALPDGSKIARIEEDRFFVMTADKKKIVFGMYKNDSEK